MNWNKLLTADKDRSIFFTSVTVLGTCVAVAAVANGLYTLTAMAAGAAVVGLIGLFAKAVHEIASPLIDTAVQSMTGRFRKFESTGHHGAHHQ